MAQPDAGNGGLPDWLTRALADERGRLLKRARLASLRAVTATASVLAAVLALVVILHPATPQELVKSLWLGSAAAIFFSGLLVSPEKLSPARLAASLDRSRGLPDAIVSALASGHHPWRRAVWEDARNRLLASRAPAGIRSGPAVAFAALAAGTMAAGAFALPPQTPVQPPNAVAGAIRSLADEWRATSGADPAAEILRKAAEAIATDARDARDVFLSAASAESILRDGLDRLARAGARTRTLSEGLRGILPGVSQALASGNPAAAGLPEASAFPENSQQSLEALAAELEQAGLGALAEAVRKLAAAKSLAERREALESLAEAMNEAERARAGSDRLAMALARLANAKDPAAGKPVPAIDLSRNEDDDSPPGTGAGSSPNRAPPAENPDLFAPQVSAVLPGRRNPGGDSYQEVFATSEGTRGAAQVGPRAVSPADYERAMRAVADERIPLSRRSTIRLYFEKLRASQ